MKVSGVQLGALRDIANGRPLSERELFSWGMNAQRLQEAGWLGGFDYTRNVHGLGPLARDLLAMSLALRDVFLSIDEIRSLTKDQRELAAVWADCGTDEEIPSYIEPMRYSPIVDMDALQMKMLWGRFTTTPAPGWWMGGIT